MFNTLVNSVANCPHCKKTYVLLQAIVQPFYTETFSSSVGARYARTRALIYFVAALIALIFSIGFTVSPIPLLHNASRNIQIGTVHTGGFVVYIIWVLAYAGTIFLFYRFVYYATLKISEYWSCSQHCR